MGLDATIRAPDARPLGDLADVQRALMEAFPGVVLGDEPSGAEKIRDASAQGIEFPEILRRHLETRPAQHVGDYQSPDFSAEFHLGASEVVEVVHVVLRGETEASGPMFALLERRRGWITTYP